MLAVRNWAIMTSPPQQIEVECPKCGKDLLPIAYGVPGPGMMDADRRGEIALGGCVVSDNDPEWRCSACEKSFFDSDVD